MLPGIGVFGTGVGVRCLVPIVKSHGFRVLALWGRSKEQAECVAHDLEIGFATSKVDEVLLHPDVDLVLIHCAPHTHSQIAVKALSIGKHVICGSPSSPDPSNALRMLHAAQYYPTLLSLSFGGSLRFLPCFLQMRQLIAEGYVGDLYLFEVQVHSGSLLLSGGGVNHSSSSCGAASYDWRCDARMGGGVLNTYGAQFVDLINYLCGANQRVKRVLGSLKTYRRRPAHLPEIRHVNADDFCMFQMELESLSLSPSSTDRPSPPPPRTLTSDVLTAAVTLNSHAGHGYSQQVLVCGSRGHLVVRGADLYGYQSDRSAGASDADKTQPGSKEELLLEDKSSPFDSESSPSSDLSRSDVPAIQLQSLMLLIAAVKQAFDAVDEKHGWSETPLAGRVATFTDCLYTQSVLDAVRRSHQQRVWVNVDTPSPLDESNPASDASQEVNSPM